MTRKKTTLALLFLVVLALGVFIGVKLKLPRPAIASATGKPVPDFVLRDQDGKEFALASQRGHRVLLMFYRGYW